MLIHHGGPFDGDSPPDSRPDHSDHHGHRAVVRHLKLCRSLASSRRTNESGCQTIVRGDQLPRVSFPSPMPARRTNNSPLGSTARASASRNFQVRICAYGDAAGCASNHIHICCYVNLGCSAYRDRSTGTCSTIGGEYEQIASRRVIFILVKNAIVCIQGDVYSCDARVRPGSFRPSPACIDAGG